MKEDYLDVLDYAYEKLNHTLCLNQIEGNLKFGIDSENKIDCKDPEEMVECLEIIDEVICRYRRLATACSESFVNIKNIIEGEK